LKSKPTIQPVRVLPHDQLNKQTEQRFLLRRPYITQICHEIHESREYSSKTKLLSGAFNEHKLIGGDLTFKLKQTAMAIHAQDGT
jgi:hypothetical protein